MSFLNWILLGGMAALAAPLIIHLLNRTRFKVVEWGAMHLLEAALQANSQRIQWQSLLLLLIRCLIPILLAFALARPVFTSWRAAGGAGDRSLVILLDNSVSMQAMGTSGTTRFQQAVEEAHAVVERQAPSTEIGLWTIGGQPIDVLNGTTFDHARVSNKLKSLPSGAGSIPIQSALSTALKQVSTMQNASREVIVVSDFQDHEWKAFGDGERAAIKQQLAAEKIPVQLTLLPVPATTAKDNLSVAISPLEQPLVVIDQLFRISATVRNHSDQLAENVSIVLQVAGTEVASRRLSVPPGGATQAVFDCQIESPGTHVVKVKIEDTAGLTGDNTSTQVVNVRTPLRVLLVDQQANAPELQRASGYLSLALSPFQSGDPANNYMLTRAINPDQLTKSEIEDHDVIVIGEALRLNDKAADEIAEFVRHGGGLMLFSCNSIDKNWYNARWGAASKTPLLAADFAPEAKPQLAAARISTELPSHAALGLFKQLGSVDFSSVEVKAVQTLNLKSDSDSTGSAAHVLLSLESGEAILVTKPLGAGNVLQFAISADTRDSNLPLRPIYVPLMQSLVQWLALGVEPVRNTTTGQSLAIKSPIKSMDETKVSTERIAVVTLPDQSKVEQKFDRNGQLSFTETIFPGIYSVATATDSSVAKLENIERYAVNVLSEESEMRFLTREKLDELASATGASVATDAHELLTMQSLRANGREAWRWFLLALVALLFVELWWQQRIARGSL